MPQDRHMWITKEELQEDFWGSVSKITERFASKNYILTRNGSLTFKEAADYSDKLAHVISQKGIATASGVGLFFTDPIQIVTGMLGVMKSRNYFVILDVSYPESMIKGMIRDAKISLILTESKFLQKIRSIAGEDFYIIAVDELNTLITTTAAIPEYKIDDFVQIMFTSGSSGRPKGVIEDYRYLIRAIFLRLQSKEYKSEDKILQLSTLNFSGPHILVFTMLLVGGTLCFFNVTEDGFNGLPEWIRELGITVYTSTPTTFRGVVNTLEPGETFPSIRSASLGGEKRLKNDLLAIKQHFPNSRYIRMGYVGTEMQGVSRSLYPIDQALEQEILPSGTPYDDIKVFIWDENGNSLPRGKEGEIVIYGDSLSRGYINNPELTKQKFLPDENNPGWQYFKTGDLGFIQGDGQLMVLDRIDKMVKIRGVRIEVDSIENHLLSYPGIIHVATKVIEDKKGTKRLVAYYSTKSGGQVSVADLRKYLSERLPSQQLPSYFVHMEEMPITGSGKVGFKDLPWPTTTRPELENPVVQPSTITEQLLLTIWEEQLGITGVGVMDDFFDIGGDSLIGVIIFVEIERSFNKTLPVSALLTTPTIRQLATLIENTTEIVPDMVLIPIKTSGNKSPLFFIPGKGGYPTRIRHLAKRLNPDIPVYAFQNTLSEQNNNHPYTLEFVAEQYLKEIKKIQPQGKFTLVGESMGGIICYEIAQQAIRFGYTPPFLVLLDTYFDDKSIPKQYRSYQNLYFYRMLLKKHSSIWFSSSWQGKKEYLQFYKEILLEKSRRFLQYRVKKHTKLMEHTLPEKYARIERNNWKAAKAYLAKPYPAQVLFVMASRGPESNILAHGWDKVGIKELIIEKLDCYHGSMLFEPAVTELANIIQSHIKLNPEATSHYVDNF